MKKLIWALWVVAGCAGGERPTDAEIHATATCDVGWKARAYPADTCETPCVQFHTTNAPRNDPDVCRSTPVGVDGPTCSESTAFDYKGVTGCCIVEPNGLVVFAVCLGD